MRKTIESMVLFVLAVTAGCGPSEQELKEQAITQRVERWCAADRKDYNSIASDLNYLLAGLTPQTREHPRIRYLSGRLDRALQANLSRNERRRRPAYTRSELTDLFRDLDRACRCNVAAMQELPLLIKQLESLKESLKGKVLAQDAIVLPLLDDALADLTAGQEAGYGALVVYHAKKMQECALAFSSGQKPSAAGIELARMRLHKLKAGKNPTSHQKLHMREAEEGLRLWRHVVTKTSCDPDPIREFICNHVRLAQGSPIADIDRSGMEVVFDEICKVEDFLQDFSDNSIAMDHLQAAKEAYRSQLELMSREYAHADEIKTQWEQRCKIIRNRLSLALAEAW